MPRGARAAATGAAGTGALTRHDRPLLDRLLRTTSLTLRTMPAMCFATFISLIAISRRLFSVYDCMSFEEDSLSSPTRSSDFVASGSDDYHLASGSNAIDQGSTLAGVTADRDGVTRPQGQAYDVGAYEYCPGGCGGADIIFDDNFETGDTTRWSGVYPP